MLPVRFHHLKAMAQSPAHCKLVMDGETKNPTQAMERGTALHAILFGTKSVVAYPGAVRRGKEWEAFAADNAESWILTQNDLAKVQGMAASVRSHKEAMRLLDGEREQTILYDNQGRPCRVTPDVRTPSFVTELKSAATVNPAKFVWHALKMGYHAQLAMQREGVQLSGLPLPREAYVVAVEQSPPFPVVVWHLTPRALDQGTRLVRVWFERLLVCEAAGHFPGYVESVIDLDVPEDVELQFGDEAAEAA